MHVRKTWLAIDSFEDGREPWAKECGPPLEAEKGKAIILS